ncbi:MAG: DUF4832 domain-containing protein [Actinomycetales bacterium]|nr:DUF4832 domain-containing protein [Actinomycetales bacterium]
MPIVLIILMGAGLVLHANLGSPQRRPDPAAQHGDQTAGSASATPTPSVSTSTPPAPLVKVTYPGTRAVLTNPERGLTHVTSCDKYPLSVTELRRWRTRDHISLIWCYFYLEPFRSSDISPAALQNMQRQLNTIRKAGLKTVLRFAYTDDTAGDDAAPAQVLRHIAQLEPYLRRHADVIVTVQAGFVGTWGEWAFTQHFGSPSGRLVDNNAADWRNRRAVIDALLDALPASRSVQLRTPAYKRHFFGSTALTAGQAHHGTARSRVGFHNDCFLASDTDMGTFSAASERSYLRQETRYVPMGGETCGLNPPRSTCPTALNELARYHWTYLNSDDTAVLGSWRTGGCMKQVERRLGYRLVLVRGTYPKTVTRATGLRIRLSIRNDGWAAPVNPRRVQLLLRAANGRVIRRVALKVDPRTWLPGTTTIDQTITVPDDLPNGRYRLFLALPDPTAALAGRAEYAVRTANAGLWDSTTGSNDLRHIVTVTG